MPLPVIADTFRTTLNWQDVSMGISAHNVLHFYAPTKTEGDVFTALDAHVTAAMWDWPSSNAKVTSVDIIKLDGSAITVNHAIAGSPGKWNGGGLGTSLPQVAGIVKLKSGVRGRSYRGRVFIPYVGEGEVAGNVLIDVAAVQAAWDTFKAAMVADGVTQVIASYKLATQRAVINHVAEAKTATQRRRNHR